MSYFFAGICLILVYSGGGPVLLCELKIPSTPRPAFSLFVVSFDHQEFFYFSEFKFINHFLLCLA